MALHDSADSTQHLNGWRRVLGWDWMVLVWVPILCIGLLHYATHSDQAWVHNVLRRLYYLPIVVAAVRGGLLSGLAASLLVSVSYAPHAFLHQVTAMTGAAVHHHMANADPAAGLDKALEIVLYNAVGIVAGVLSDSERRRRTQLRDALETQQRLQQQLVRAGRLSALGEVVAGIAHEVRNPLHALRGTAEVVDHLIPKESDERRLWELHVSELERLERVAQRFLSFASPEVGARAALDLRDVAARLVALIEADARKRGVSLECIAGSQPAMVQGDRDQLAQVVLNIALNAMRAIGSAGGRIKVSVRGASPGEGHHQLVVENDGPPLQEQEIERLFDPFHGGDPAGAGLGLSISERIVDQHGGFIVAANAGLGVSFSVHLPSVKTGLEQ
jgi:two-component system sensor histidine kinase HydH